MQSRDTPVRPPWVQGALSAGGVELGPPIQVKKIRDGVPVWTEHSGEDYEALVEAYGMGEHTHWEGVGVPRAGYTCDDCPQPLRSHQTYEKEVVYVGKEQRPVKPFTWLHTKRCRDCETLVKRWRMGKVAADRVIQVNSLHPKARQVVFLTLTTKNYPKTLSDAEAIRTFKREVTKWRRTSGVLEHFLGGYDFYEVTTNSRTGTKNAHAHSVYVQSAYWKQSEMLASWKRGGVRIEAKPAKQAVRYCTGYAGKTPVEGVRCKESWGACRGKAYEDVLSAYGEDAAQESETPPREQSSVLHAVVSSVIGRIRTAWRGTVQWAVGCATYHQRMARARVRWIERQTRLEAERDRERSLDWARAKEEARRESLHRDWEAKPHEIPKQKGRQTTFDDWSD